MKDFLDYRKSKGEANYTNTPMTPTGFMYFDYNNGKRQIVYDDNEILQEAHTQLGIVNGSIVTITGRSGTGKTTLGLQLAQSILHPFVSKVLNEYVSEDDMDTLPLLEIYDVENKFDISMAKRATQYKNKILKRICTVHRDKKDKDISNRLNEHIEFKKKFMKKIKYKFKDIYGDNYSAYPPSVILIDSVNQIESSKIETYEDMVGNTAGLIRAKAIQNLFNEMSDVCHKYNITIFVIQHILTDSNLGIMPKAKQYMGLKKDEKFGAGEKGILLSTNIIRLEFVDWIGEKALGDKLKLYTNLGDGIEGFIVSCTIIKSSTNAFGRKCRLINLGNTGFNRLLSTFYEATLRGDLEKKGNFYYLPGYDRRLSLKNFLEECRNDDSLVKKFYNHMTDRLMSLVSIEGKNKKEKTTKEEIVEDFFNMDDED